MVADYQSKLFLHWILIAFMSIYNVQTEGRVSQNASWINAMRNCQKEMLDMMCVTDQSNLTSVAQYLMKENIQSMWVKNNATIHFLTNETGCTSSSLDRLIRTANKTCLSCNCTTFCVLRSSNYHLVKNHRCFCFRGLPPDYDVCNKVNCNNCGNKEVVYFTGAVQVQYCTHIYIRNKEVCMEQTEKCDQKRHVLCNNDSTSRLRPTCDIIFNQNRKPKGDKQCLDLHNRHDPDEQNVINDHNQQSQNADEKESGTLVTVLAVVVVVVVATITVVVVIFIYKRRKRPKGEAQTPTDKELPNNTMANLYTDLSNEDNYQCASEYDYIKESDINQNAKYDKIHTNQYEASTNLGNNYFILEPQNKAEDNVVAGADDDGEYVDKVEGDYHHLNETTERKDALSKEDNLYNHGQNNKGSDGTYDTTNTIKDNIDLSEYNTVDSVKDDETYNKLA